MASPFHVFRKNQKAMIATLGLLAIGAFVFLTPLAMYKGGSWSDGGNKGDEVVVTTTKYGDLNERDLSNMRRESQQLLQFFMNLVSVSHQDDPAKVMQYQNALMQFFGNTSEEAAVNTWLLAKQAEEQGMSIDDTTVGEFIRQVTQDKIPGTVIKEIQVSNKLTEDGLYSLLRQKLLAESYSDSFINSLRPATPGQRWDYFQRLNRKVTAQVAPVVVANFVEQVPEPTEKELKEFFEEHKNNIHYPGSPTPGFRVAQMADIEYLKADYDKYTDPQSITDEEIENYYLENRDDYKIYSLPGESEDMMPVETPSLLRSSLNGNLDAITPAKPEAPATEAPATEVPAPATEAPAAEKPASEVPATETPAAETPETPKAEAAPEKPAEPAKTEEAPKAEEAPKEEAPKSDTSSVTRSVFHLVSMQEETKAEPSAPEQPAEASKPEEAKTDEAKEPEAKAVDSAAPGATPAMIGSGLSELPPTATQAPTISGNAYKPLDEVKNEIRYLLALQKTRDRMEKVLSQARKEVKDYNDKLAISEAELSDEETSKRLSQFAKDVATKNNLTYGKTGLLSAIEIAQTDIGKSLVKDVHQSVAAVAIERMNDMQFRSSSDMDLNNYLFWRVKKTEEKTPELSDEGVREKVVQAWKQMKARELATKEAERLAKDVEKSGTTLRNSIGKSEGIPVKSTGEFSWYKYDFAPGIGQSIGVGRPENVDMPGWDFMKAIYSLEPNGVTVAMNGPKTIAYVIQLTNTTPTEELWQIFKNYNFANYQDIAEVNNRLIVSEWLKNIKDEAGLKWKRSAISPNTQQR